MYYVYLIEIVSGQGNRYLRMTIDLKSVSNSTTQENLPILQNSSHGN